MEFRTRWVSVWNGPTALAIARRGAVRREFGSGEQRACDASGTQPRVRIGGGDWRCRPHRGRRAWARACRGRSAESCGCVDLPSGCPQSLCARGAIAHRVAGVAPRQGNRSSGIGTSVFELQVGKRRERRLCSGAARRVDVPAVRYRMRGHALKKRSRCRADIDAFWSHAELPAQRSQFVYLES